MRWRKCGIDFGITGITQKQTAEVIAEYFYKQPIYDSQKQLYFVEENEERQWVVGSDPDIEPERMMSDKRIKGSFFYQTKITTPILHERDFQSVADIMENLFSRGALVNNTTKMIVNVDSSGLMSPNRFAENIECVQQGKDKLLKKALKTDFGVLAEMKEENIISFPIFQSSPDWNETRSFIQLAQGITNYADKTKTVSPKENPSANDKFTMRTWLVKIGMIGDDFKEARKIFTKHLSGNTAWLNRIEVEKMDGNKLNIEKEIIENNTGMDAEYHIQTEDKAEEDEIEEMEQEQEGGICPCL